MNEQEEIDVLVQLYRFAGMYNGAQEYTLRQNAMYAVRGNRANRMHRYEHLNLGYGPRDLFVTIDTSTKNVNTSRSRPSTQF